MLIFLYLFQVDDARTKFSDESAKMYNSLLDAQEKSKDSDKRFKDLMKEVQTINKEKEVVEKRLTEAIKNQTALELDVKDIQERISGNSQARVMLH